MTKIQTSTLIAFFTLFLGLLNMFFMFGEDSSLINHIAFYMCMVSTIFQCVVIREMKKFDRLLLAVNRLRVPKARS